MQQLNSKNYDTVNVITRDDIIVMPADKGAALMQYLTTEGASSHVMITDVNGTQTVVSRHEIKKVQPVFNKSTYKTAGELGMSDLALTEERRIDNLSRIDDMRRKFKER